MERVSTEKVVGGKLLRIKVDYDNVFKKVQITGDFFAHPEDGIEDIEKSLVGLEINKDENFLTLKIKEVAEKSNLKLVGISVEDIARNLKKAVS